MKKITKKIIRFAFFPLILFDYVRFSRAMKKGGRFTLALSDVYPCVSDKTIKTGFDRHYVYHTSWAARKVRDAGAPLHTDISSSLFFSGIVSAFVPVEFYDYRPAQLKLSSLRSEHADLTQLQFSDNSIRSLSCMHTIEHIGLGRYGDPIDTDGDIKACKELSRVLAINGQLIFVTPVGRPRIEFNAHRIYSYQQVLDLFPDLELREFSLVTDTAEQGDFIEHADPSLVSEQKYGCGCFTFTKHDNR